jgi:hypothetical protein
VWEPCDQHSPALRWSIQAHLDGSLYIFQAHGVPGDTMEPSRQCLLFTNDSLSLGTCDGPSSSGWTLANGILAHGPSGACESVDATTGGAVTTPYGEADFMLTVTRPFLDL